MAFLETWPMGLKTQSEREGKNREKNNKCKGRNIFKYGWGIIKDKKHRDE